MLNPNLNRLVDALLEDDQARAIAEAISLRRRLVWSLIGQKATTYSFLCSIDTPGKTISEK
jgi:hypothetical protein